MNDMSPVSTQDAAPVDAAAPPRRARLVRRLLFWGVPLLIAAVGLFFWLTSGRTVSTDNAQVGAHVVNVAPEVTGPITSVRVVENQHVNAGDLLYTIDPRPYRIALMQAEAAVGNARLQIAQYESDYSSKVSDISVRASDVDLTAQNYRRQQELLDKGFTTRARFDEARAALVSAQAQRRTAVADAASARAVLGTSSRGGHPQVEAAIAQRDRAALDLARTEVHAPIAGVASGVDKLSPGAMAMQTLPNVTIVGGGDYWLEANFKETQLAKIRPGQRAEVAIDAIPGQTFAAHVVGIGSGTGSEFSLLPAQNATGNWVKVTQRVPVRLKLDRPPGRPLVAGWSAHVTVHVAD